MAMLRRAKSALLLCYYDEFAVAAAMSVTFDTSVEGVIVYVEIRVNGYYTVMKRTVTLGYVVARCAPNYIRLSGGGVVYVVVAILSAMLLLRARERMPRERALSRCRLLLHYDIIVTRAEMRHAPHAERLRHATLDISLLFTLFAELR